MKKDEVIIAQASDNYNLINQDDHAIVVNGEYQFTMSGGFKVWGEKYTLKDFNNNEIAHANFNVFNTEGTLIDNDGNLIAKYESNYFRRDYTVTIFDTNLNHNALLLVFASYYSDFAADNNSSNN